MPITQNRTVAATRSVLALDGTECGFLISAAGGDVVADVIETRQDGSGLVRKTIGPPTVEPVTIQLGFSMEQPVYDWIASSWAGRAGPRAVSIVQTDLDLARVREYRFYDALVTGTTFSALDAASQEAMVMTVRFAAATTMDAPATGPASQPTVQPRKAMQCNFRLELDGIDCGFVSKIDPFTVTRALVDDTRGYEKEPANVEFPNLRVTLTEQRAESLTDWFQRFVVQGENGEAEEKNGSIVLLAKDMKTEICRVNLFGVGIFALRRQLQPDRDEAPRLTADLYCERMELA
jgi:hypothetical protein